MRFRGLISEPFLAGEEELNDVIRAASFVLEGDEQEILLKSDTSSIRLPILAVRILRSALSLLSLGHGVVIESLKALLPVDEVAYMLAFKQETVQKLINDGKLESVMSEGKSTVTLRSLIAYKRARKKLLGELTSLGEEVRTLRDE
jgi:hypothetical protein